MDMSKKEKFQKSEEKTKKRIGARKGVTLPQELREKIRQSILKLGYRHDTKTREKISKNRIGIPVKESAKIKIALTKQGERNWNSKLTAEKVLEIRSLENKFPISYIAKKYKISYAHTKAIILKKRWKHI